MSVTKLGLAMACCFSIVACGGESVAPPPLPPGHMPMPSMSPSPSPSPSPSESPAPVQAGRAARRVSVAQLRKSIPRLFAGVTWTQGRQQMFDLLSRTLGEANYLQATEENLDPNPIFAKFMDDMAGQVCTTAVTADARAVGSTEKAVLAYPTDPARNLRFLRLKLHGIHVPDGSNEGIEKLLALYEGVLGETSSAEQAWIGVCIAMLTAPELMAY